LFLGLRLVLDVHGRNSKGKTGLFVDLGFISIKSPVHGLAY
jgi:hypothetical protein